MDLLELSTWYLKDYYNKESLWKMMMNFKMDSVVENSNF